MNLGTGQSAAQTITKDYRALGRLVAYRKNGTLSWVGTDHLGGTVKVTDASYNLLGSERYAPYGSNRDAGAALGTDQQFTGQTWDSVPGLYWYGSRAYDPSLGRFCQPDSIVPSPVDPQSLNRYSYAANNPVKFLEPTGHANELYSGDDSDPLWLGGEPAPRPDNFPAVANPIFVVLDAHDGGQRSITINPVSRPVSAPTPVATAAPFTVATNGWELITESVQDGSSDTESTPSPPNEAG